MTRRTITCLALCLLASLMAAFPAPAKVYIDITQPFSRRLPLALPDFQPMPGSAPHGISQQGPRLLQGDLTYTGLFELLNKSGFLAPPKVPQVNYAMWKRVGAELLITGNYRVNGEVLALECRLYDVVDGKLLTGRRYNGRLSDLPTMMQRFADEVMLALTGERSVFSTQIAFVGARQGQGKVIKEIYLMNYNGTGVRRFTHRGDLSLYPAWSSDGSLLAYSSYVKRHPVVYIHALRGGGGKIAVNRPGVNITPVFRPGSTQMAVAMSHTGRTNIFLADVAGQVLKRLTMGWGMEVSPSFSPDGRNMAFVSDRGGNPQIYVTNLATGQINRLTFGFKYSSSPHWSPRGDRIAFQARVDGVFQICTVSPNGTGLQVLTAGYGGGEDPSWSPDGRLIAYAGRRTGRYQVYLMTSDGRPIRRLTSLPGDNTDPAWSPRGVVNPRN